MTIAKMQIVPFVRPEMAISITVLLPPATVVYEDEQVGAVAKVELKNWQVIGNKIPVPPPKFDKPWSNESGA